MILLRRNDAKRRIAAWAIWRSRKGSYYYRRCPGWHSTTSPDWIIWFSKGRSHDRLFYAQLKIQPLSEIAAWYIHCKDFRYKRRHNVTWSPKPLPSVRRYPGKSNIDYNWSGSNKNKKFHNFRTMMCVQVSVNTQQDKEGRIGVWMRIKNERTKA